MGANGWVTCNKANLPEARLIHGRGVPTATVTALLLLLLLEAPAAKRFSLSTFAAMQITIAAQTIGGLVMKRSREMSPNHSIALSVPASILSRPLSSPPAAAPTTAPLHGHPRHYHCH